MIKTKDGYVKMIDSKYQGHDHKLLSSNGGDWEVHKSRNNEPDKIVRTDSTGAISTDKALIYSELSLNDKKAYIHRLGQSGTIGKGRDSAVIKTTSYSSNSTLFSHKSSTGSWDLSTSSNKLNLHYISDSYYNSGEGDFNTLTFPNKTGTLATTLDIPSISIVAGKSKETVNAEEKNPYLMLISKVKDSAGVETVKNIGQVRILGTGSTNINSNANGSIYVSSVLYKAGTGLSETPVAATNITGYTTNTLAVKLGYQEQGANYPVKSHTTGLYVTVPWRTIKVKDSSINRLELNLLEGDNVKLVKSNSEDNLTANVTISAIDTLYDAGSGLTLSGTTFKVNTGSDDKVNRIYGVKVDAENKLYTKVPWTDDKVTSVENHYAPVTDEQKQLKASSQEGTDITGTGGKLSVVVGLDRDAKGHITGLISKKIYSTDTKSFTITATAKDDDIVILSGTDGTNAVTYSASHAEKGPKSGYSSGNTTTSISGYGNSGTIKIPQITVDKYGHVTVATDESITITMPDKQTIPTLSDLGGISGINIASANKDNNPILTLTASKSGTTVTLGGSVAEMVGATSAKEGRTGLVPKPAKGEQTQYLKGDGTWGTPQNTTYSASTGLSLSTDNKFSLKTATSGQLGGIQLGYSESGKKYAVKLDSSNKAYVEVPWESADMSGYLPLSGGTMTDSIITPANDNMGIIPENDNYGQIGSSSKKFYRMYASTFYGNLSGTADSADYHKYSYSQPGIIWMGTLYRSYRSSTSWYLSKNGGDATMTFDINQAIEANGYHLKMHCSSSHIILGATCSIQAQFNADKEGGAYNEGPIYAYDTYNVSKIEEAGTEIFVVSVRYGDLYIKALRASDDNNTSYYFDGFAFTGKGENKNSLPLARVNLIVFGYQY